MSEHTHTASPFHLAIERNGVTLQTKPHKFIRGENQNKEFPSIEVAPSESYILSVAKWLGYDTAASCFSRLIKSASQNSYLESIGETGEFDPNKFIVLLQEFTSVSLKKSQLEDREFELTTRMLSISDAIEKALDANDLDALKIARDEGTEIKAQLRVTRDAIQNKSRQKKEAEAQPAIVS